MPACDGQPDLNYELAGTDTIELIFFKKKTSAPQDTVIIKEKSIIKELIHSLGKESPKFKCAATGKIRFLKQRVKYTLLESELSLLPDCSFIAFVLHDRLYFRQIDSNGKELIELAGKYREVLKSMD